MDDIQQKISEILSDPQALEQVKSLGSMLGIDKNTVPPSPPVTTMQNTNNAQSGDLLSALGGLSPENLSMITRLLPMFSDMNSENDTTRLLDAVAPFLGIEKREKVQKAKKFVHLFKMLPLLKSGDLF